MITSFKSPLTVYVLWHPKFADGEVLANRLFTTLSRNVNDPFARSIGIPVFYRSHAFKPGSEAPAPIPFDESDYNAIVVFVDPIMLRRKDWQEYMKDLVKKTGLDPAHNRIFPFANSYESFGSAELGALNYIRMYEAIGSDVYGNGVEVPDLNEGEIQGLLDDIESKAAQIKSLEAQLQALKQGKPIPVSPTLPQVSGAMDEGAFSVNVNRSAGSGGGININITINNADPGEVSIMDAPVEASPTLEGDLSDIEKMGNLMMSKLTHELCRLILSFPEKTETGVTISSKPVKLFLSHAKADGADIALEIKNYIESDSSMKTFFDANDIAPGYRFDNELKGAIEDATLICIQTDYYATREWCLFEVINAKRYDRPLVVLNAVKKREPRSFPYIGNVPTARWNPYAKARCREIVDLALFELLDSTYSKMFGRALQDLYTIDNVYPIGHAPELFTILRIREKIKKKEVSESPETTYILYPDPPLGSEEVNILQELAPDLQFITPTMLPVIEYKIEPK